MRLPTPAAALLFLACATMPGRPDDLANHLLVVFNSNNPQSRELAHAYAFLRKIPAERILGLPASHNETISRAEFESTLRDPLEKEFSARGWLAREKTRFLWQGKQIDGMACTRNHIWAMVLIRGLPLRIEQDPSQPPLSADAPQPMQFNYASVDSELTLLPTLGTPLAGPVPNPFFSLTEPRTFFADWARRLILVCRLDAPSQETALRMLRDSLAAEKNGLTGRAVFDCRSITEEGLKAGDEWITGAARLFEEAHFDTLRDDAPAVLPASAPLDDIAIYAGWYEEHPAGLFTRPDWSFRTGAIAYHIHSFSAATLRNPARHWAAPLLQKGAAATFGPVYEPYLAFTPHVAVFFNRLLQGATFAEAAYQSTPSLSWTLVFAGDPLYRPFLRPPPAGDPWSRAREARRIATGPGAYERVRGLLLDPPHPHTLETLGDLGVRLGGKESEILSAYQSAATLSNSTATRVRCILKSARYLTDKGGIDRALALCQSLAAQDPAATLTYAVAAEALQMASSHGRTLPPDLQALLPPPPPAPAPTATTPPPVPQDAMAARARRELVPTQPSFTPPKVPANQTPGRLPAPTDPNRLPPPRAPAP